MLRVDLSIPSHTDQAWSLEAADLLNAYTQFQLSRQAMRCSPTTLAFYRYTAGAFLGWLQSHGVLTPSEVAARHVREYLAELVGLGRSDQTVHDHARAIRTLLRFWHAEAYLPSPVIFDMPKLLQKRLPVLSAEQLQQLLAADLSARDRALNLFLVDSGLRRAEVCNLNCEDIDLGVGLVHVHQGKGGKDRSAVISPTVRRALLAYRRDLQSPACAGEPLFTSRRGGRLTGAYLVIIFRRLSQRTGIPFTAHALRRTFAILSLRAGADILHLQAQLGHSSLEMVRRYAQMVDDDLLQDHQAHSPIENLARLRQLRAR